MVGVFHFALFCCGVALDVIKMAYAQPSVYRENCFSVDLRENPMFTRVKQGSNSLEINKTQGQVALVIVCRVEIADNLLGLSLRVGAVRLHPSGCDWRTFGRLTVLGLPIA